MNVGGNLGLFSFVCMLAIAVYLQCFTESEFIFYPLIDTQLPSGFTQAKFDSIKPGMTKADILKILPAPEYLGTDSWTYGNDGAAPFGDFAWFQFIISFDKEELVTKTERIKFHD